MKKWFKKTWNYLKKHTKGLHKTISYVCRKTDHFRIYVFFDIIRCYIKYGANYNEYRIFEFYLINKKLEDTYLTKVRHDNFTPYLYNKNKLELLKDRREFYKKFDKYLKRNTCYSKNLSFKQMEELVNASKCVVCKSDTLKEEKTEILNLKDFRSPAFLLEEATKNKLYILEETVKQNELIEEINPNNINILSIVTLKDKNNVDVISATIKFGTSETFEYDYKKSDYITGFIDIDTGMVKHKYRSRNGRIFSNHPITGEKIINLEIPNFKKAIDTAKKCAKAVDDILEIEWNFMIAKSQVLLISANLWEDYTFSQIPEFLDKKVGLMPYHRYHVDKSKKL